tara:strand:- start:1412 stop:1516 length:105 start_codon:yes stop_codon:yes gene_type:complete
MGWKGMGCAEDLGSVRSGEERRGEERTSKVQDKP